MSSNGDFAGRSLSKKNKKSERDLKRLTHLTTFSFARYAVDHEVCLVRSKSYKLIKVFNSLSKHKTTKLEMI